MGIAMTSEDLMKQSPTDWWQRWQTSVPNTHSVNREVSTRILISLMLDMLEMLATFIISCAKSSIPAGVSLVSL